MFLAWEVDLANKDVKDYRVHLEIRLVRFTSTALTSWPPLHSPPKPHFHLGPGTNVTPPDLHPLCSLWAGFELAFPRMEGGRTNEDAKNGSQTLTCLLRSGEWGLPARLLPAGLHYTDSRHFALKLSWNMQKKIPWLVFSCVVLLNKFASAMEKKKWYSSYGYVISKFQWNVPGATDFAEMKAEPCISNEPGWFSYIGETRASHIFYSSHFFCKLLLSALCASW